MSSVIFCSVVSSVGISLDLASLICFSTTGSSRTCSGLVDISVSCLDISSATFDLSSSTGSS